MLKTLISIELQNQWKAIVYIVDFPNDMEYVDHREKYIFYIFGESDK